jgi:hypothetical protein
MKDNQFNNGEMNISSEPVHYLEADQGKEPEEGTALCLSGGGDAIKTISEILEVKPLLAEEINKLHMTGVLAEEIAERLEHEEGGDQLELPTAIL